MKKILNVKRDLFVSIFVVMLLIYSMQGVSYAQDVSPGADELFNRGDTLVVTPGETNSSLKVIFIDRSYEFNKRGYQVQLRRKDPQGDWMLKCDTIKGWLVSRPNFSEYFTMIFTDLEPDTTYEARWRETNEESCPDNPADPGEWSPIREGTTLLETPPRIEFADTNLAIVVRLTLGLDIIDGVDILKIPEEQLTQLTTLSWSAVKEPMNRFLPEELDLPRITNLTGLEHATQLGTLRLVNQRISDISPLAALTELRELDLEVNQISDISLLAQFTELRELELSSNDIRDISPLAQLTELTLLGLSGNRISDITTLTQLTKLTSLSLVGNQIRDIMPLAQLTQLRRLFLGYNQIRELTPLAQLSSLETLVLSDNQIRDVTPLAQLADASLTNLDLSRNQIRDVTPLAQLTNLETLVLSGNQIRDVTPLAQLADASLTNLDLSWNQIQDVSPLGDLIYLERLTLSSNPIADTFPLSALLDANPDIDIDIKVNREKRPTITASTPEPLTAATLNGSVVTLTLSSGDFIHGVRDELTISGITGVSVDRTNYAGEGKITVELKFEGNLEKDAILTFTLEADAIEGYDGPSLTAKIPVSAGAEGVLTDASTTDVKLSISPALVASPATGEQLEVSLNITGGEAVAGYQATVQFDETALRYVSSANGDFLLAGAFFVQSVVEGNLVKLNAASLAGETDGDGTLATLTFEVIAAKASTLTLPDVLLTNSAGEAFVPTVENAEITVPTGLKADVNGDGIVNIQDLVLVAGRLGQTGTNSADVNDDGVVNIQDLVLVAGALGTSAAAPSLNSQALEILTASDVKQWLSAAQLLDITDAMSQRGILFLEQLLIVLTPNETALLANYPNPFNPETWIPYHLSKNADVTLHIYAMNGTLVRTLTLGYQTAGMYQNRSRAAYWDGKNEFGEAVASGLYFYTLTAGDFSATRKMLIRK